MSNYDGVQSPSTRQFLSKWSNNYGWASILTSLLLPLFGIYLAGVSIAFSSKRRDKVRIFPYSALLVALGLLFVHMWLWARVIEAI